MRVSLQQKYKPKNNKTAKYFVKHAKTCSGILKWGYFRRRTSVHFLFEIMEELQLGNTTARVSTYSFRKL